MEKLLTFAIAVLIGASSAETFGQTYWTDEGNYDTSWYDADATEYVIGNAGELAGLAVLASIPSYGDSETGELSPGPNTMFENKTIRLSADVDLSGYDWIPFDLNLGGSGVFDGDGHTIDGMLIKPVDQSKYADGYFGLFSECECVKNLTIGGKSEINIPAGIRRYGVGSIAGRAISMENCVNKAKITVDSELYSSDFGVGGLSAYCMNLKDCVNDGDITVYAGQVYVGGMSAGDGNGYSPSYADGCINNGDITVIAAEGYAISVGGICGGYNRESDVQVMNSGNTGQIYVKAESEFNGSNSVYAYSIAPHNTVMNCYNLGSVIVEGGNGNCMGGNVAPDCVNCYTLSTINVKELYHFEIWSACYRFGGDESRFCYVPAAENFEGAIKVADMKSQEFRDLLNRNVATLDNSKLQKWVMGSAGYPVLEGRGSGAGVSVPSFDGFTDDSGIYLLDGRRVKDLSKVKIGEIYIVNGRKYVKTQAY